MAYTTRKSLLLKVRDGEEIGWTEFYRTYRPLIIVRGLDFGLHDQELEELVQKVMLEFFHKDIFHTRFDIENIPESLSFRYDKAKGRFRDFLRNVVRNHATHILAQRRTDHEPISDFEDMLPDQRNPMEDAWHEEWQKHLLNMALLELKNHVKAQSWQVFEMLAIQRKSPEEVAKTLEMSCAAVYTAKSRCMVLLKNEIIPNLEDSK